MRHRAIERGGLGDVSAPAEEPGRRGTLGRQPI